jgi:hypothetical protein
MMVLYFSLQKNIIHFFIHKSKIASITNWILSRLLFWFTLPFFAQLWCNIIFKTDGMKFNAYGITFFKGDHE